MLRKIGDKDIWVRTFEVIEPKKHRKGFTVYKVISTVFPRHFPEGATKITVWKRYKDFKLLSKELELIFRQLYLKGEFPKLPSDKFFGRFDGEVIEERRKSALRLLEFAASYSQLFTNKVFVKFFEAGYSINDLSINNTKNTNDEYGEQNVLLQDDQDDDKNGVCLIPERLWEESKISENLVEEDEHSLSSFTCSSPDPTVLNTESLSTSTNALNVITSQNLDKQNLHALKQPKVTTFSDSSQIAVPGSTCNSNVPSPYSLKESRKNWCMISSASLTEDLDLLPNSDPEADISQTSRSLVSNSISCLSLDTLTLRKTLDYKDTEVNNSKKKKLNGFGFFDFLPIFAKKQENKVPDEKVLAESLTATYICEAAGHFTAAHHHESNSEYASAFDAYTEGVRVLLEGAQRDTDNKRKVLVRKKIEKYLSYAESLKEKLLCDDEFFSKNNQCTSSTLSSPRKKLQGLVEQQTFNDDGFVVIESNVMPSSIEELKLYKVVGCTYNNVLVAVDTTVVGGPHCYAVKVLRKSACPLDIEKPTLIPSIIPFMVQLIKWFNTEDSVILILQYAGGGRLIDFVTTYQTKQIAIISPHEPSLTADIDEFHSLNEFAPTEDLNDAVAEDSGLVLTDETNSFKLKKKSRLQSEKEYCNRTNDKKSESETNNFQSTSVDLEQRISNRTLSLNQGVTGTVEVKINSVQTKEVVVKMDVDNEARPHFQNPTIPCVPCATEINSLDIETHELIENSLILMQTVSRTLQEQKEKSAEESVNYFTDLSNGVKVKSDHDSTPDTAPLKDNPKPEIAYEQKSKIQVPTSFLCFNRILEENATGLSHSYVTSSQDCLELKRMVPECCVKIWCAEIVIALDKLHLQGITFGDLDLCNILLGESGHIMLSYRALWNEVDTIPLWNEFSAPEIVNAYGKSLWKVHPSADWWSLGAILYFLLTGTLLCDAHPAGIHPQTVICIPTTNCCGDIISPSAKTLLLELLQYSPSIRLGYYGAEEIRSHPFFSSFDWDSAISDVLKNPVY